MTTPRTAEGQALMDAPAVLLMMDGEGIIGINEGELELWILAIEAGAAQLDVERLAAALRTVDDGIGIADHAASDYYQLFAEKVTAAYAKVKP
jgi:hypothetical protein